LGGLAPSTSNKEISVKQIRKRLTYANVMSTIAVFLVIGGASALAASQLGKNSVGSKQLKKNAVTSAKIKNNAVTTAKIKNGAVSGSKINLGSLGTVPSATNATNATNAGNAGTVGGQSVTKLYKTLTEGQVEVPVATVAGFVITASCGTNDASVRITTPTGPGTTVESGGLAGNISTDTTEAYASNKPGETGSIEIDELNEGPGNATYGVSSVYGATSAGVAISGVIGYDYDTFNESPPNTCLVAGHLTSG
jgi:hypothetical protein